MSHTHFNDEPDSEKPYNLDTFPLSHNFLSDLFKKHEIDSGDAFTKIKDNGLIPGIVTKLKSDPKTGLNSLDTGDLALREEFYGRNDPITAEMKSLWQLVRK